MKSTKEWAATDGGGYWVKKGASRQWYYANGYLAPTWKIVRVEIREVPKKGTK